MRLKTSKGGKVTYSLICVFVYFVHAKKRKKKIKKKSLQCNVLNTNVPINHIKCACVYLREPVCGDINLVYILTS